MGTRKHRGIKCTVQASSVWCMPPPGSGILKPEPPLTPAEPGPLYTLASAAWTFCTPHKTKQGSWNPTLFTDPTCKMTIKLVLWIWKHSLFPNRFTKQQGRKQNYFELHTITQGSGSNAWSRSCKPQQVMVNKVHQNLCVHLVRYDFVITLKPSGFTFGTNWYRFVDLTYLCWLDVSNPEHPTG